MTDVAECGLPAVRRRRLELGFSQTDVANLTGLMQRHVSEIERGVVSPSVNTLRRIAHALNCTVGELVEEESGVVAAK